MGYTHLKVGINIEHTLLKPGIQSDTIITSTLYLQDWCINSPPLLDARWTAWHSKLEDATR